jgi:hypothetical protein
MECTSLPTGGQAAPSSSNGHTSRTRSDGLTRFTRDFPCPVCGGCPDDRRGEGKRCWGFMSGDGEWIHCKRDEYAGKCLYHPTSETYSHKAKGPCSCGKVHGEAAWQAPKPNGEKKAWKAFTSFESAVASQEVTLSRQKKAQFACTARYYYTDPFRTARFDEVGGSRKEYRPFRRDPDGWRPLDPPAPLPLYLGGGERAQAEAELDLADVVFVVEGEKCADLLRKLGFVVVTSSHGSGSAAKTDWGPLAGKEVFLVPDKNSAGERYIDDVGKLLAELEPAPTVRVIRLDVQDDEDVEQWLERLPDMWDDDRRREALKELAAAAPIWEPATSIESVADEDDEEFSGDPVGLVDDVAFHGVMGRLVSETQEQTEANKLFVLVHLMAMFGAAVGRSPYFPRGNGLRMNPQIAVVAPTGIGRKGTSAALARAIMAAADRLFADNNIVNGLSSGRGLLDHLRDRSVKRGKDGKEVLDEGVSDKRRVCIEEEFGSVLMHGHRESEDLFCFIRQIADGQSRIHRLTKDSVTVTGAHVSIVGHSTFADVSSLLTATDKANGTANRFLWLWGVRSKQLWKGGDVQDALDNFLKPDLRELKAAIDWASKIERMRFAPTVEERWKQVYKELEDVPAGSIASLYARAPSIVLRHAGLFALADQTHDVGHPHLDASLAIWEHSKRTLKYVFASDINIEAEKLKAALKNAPGGLTKSQIINEVFKKNSAVASLDPLLTHLQADHTIVQKKVHSGRGRPAVLYFWNEW